MKLRAGHGRPRWPGRRTDRCRPAGHLDRDQVADAGPVARDVGGADRPVAGSSGTPLVEGVLLRPQVGQGSPCRAGDAEPPLLAENWVNAGLPPYVRTRRAVALIAAFERGCSAVDAAVDLAGVGVAEVVVGVAVVAPLVRGVGAGGDGLGAHGVGGPLARAPRWGRPRAGRTPTGRR